MTNLFEQAINCENGNRAAKIIQDALGIENAFKTTGLHNVCFRPEFGFSESVVAA